MVGIIVREDRFNLVKYATLKNDVDALQRMRLDDIPDSAMTTVVAVAFLSVSLKVVQFLSGNPRFASWCSKEALFPLIFDFQGGPPFPVPCSTHKFAKRAFLSGDLGHIVVLICLKGGMALGHTDVMEWAVALVSSYKHRTALTTLVKALQPSVDVRAMAVMYLLEPPPMMSLEGKIPIRMEQAVKELLSE